ncbi:MAG: gliding motility-associated-like protein [Saprospiraceae bacterium]|jgi:gliding motility-associated-like protein
MKRTLQFFIILVLCATAAIPLSAQEPECACTNCPVPIYNNSVSYAYVNVEVNGENDLSTCPLTKVCFEVSHTWIGDLSASLISPNGTRYLIMADINNDTLGCGTQFNNINVCVNIGTDNPLTNNEEYECNGPQWACLNGEDWTVPCGVTDPRTPAVVAPNCDLNDFNTSGAPANGLWTLAVSDICPWDVGFIETFSLEFECGAGCFSCESDGGAIEISDVTACAGSEDLAITATPIWETEQPDTLDYGYTFLLSQNDVILATTNNPNLTSAPAGEYQVCGFSYILIQANQLSNLIGQSLSGLQENPTFCGELSNNCGTIIITEPNETTFITLEKCENDCISYDEIEYCEAGVFELNYPDANGCNSFVQLTVNDFPANETTETELNKCSTDCVTYDNVEYCEAGIFPLTYTGENGCDSLVNLTVTDFPLIETTEVELFKCSTGCVSYDNVDYCETGVFPLTYANQNGCDSLVDLTISNYEIIASTVVNLTICENACTTYEGTEYCTIGNYEIILTGTHGCDSLINLTIENFNAIELTTASLQVCEGDCGEYDGTEYCTAGNYELTYEAVNGCDSLVNLSVSYYQTDTPTSVNMTICETSCGIYEGQEYCLNGIYNVILVNQYSCDSLVNLTVSYFDVNTPTQVNFSLCVDECATYEGEEYCEAGNYEITLIGENGCDSLVSINVAFLITEIVIETPEAINCTTASVILDASTTTADSFIWTNAEGETIGSTPTISVSEAACYTLTITNNGCEDSEEICILDESGDVTSAQISGDELVCVGSEATYTATSDASVNSYFWTIPANATMISGENTDEITLIWQDTNGGEICVAAMNDCGTGEYVCLNVISSQLELVEVTENCDIATETYIVTIEVASNSTDLQINDLTGGSWNGNIFTSGVIAGGIPFTFEITDGVCTPLLVAGLNDCVCTTFAGALVGQGVEVCQVETAILDYPENVVLDANDVLYFLIHDGTADQIGANIFDVKTEPEFDLTADMEMDVAYFSAAVAGNTLSNTIDWEDACLSISVGVPVTFLSGPTVEFTGEATICDGGEATMHLSFAGNAPFSATINGELLENLPAEYDYTVTIENTTTFDLESINDVNGCAAFPSQSVTIIVNETPSISVQPEATVCNTNDDDDIHVLNFDDLLSDNLIPGIWEDTDGSNAVGPFPSLDFYNVAPGVYTFTFTTENAEMPCENISVSVEVTVENCSCLDGSFSGSTLCNESAILDLTSLQNETTSGTWSILNTPTGQNPATINGSTFNATNADAGDYFVQFVVENAPEGCLDTWTAVIAVANYASAGESNGTLEFCAGTEEIINLTEQLVGADAGGMWTETSQVPSQNNAFDAQNATLTTNLFNPGSYTFTYTQSLESPCNSESATVMVIIYDIPLADAGEEQTLTCEQSSAVLGGINTSQGEGLTYTWSVTDGFFSNEINPEITEQGTYTLTVTNEFGCTSSDEVIIEIVESAPVADITVTSVGCYGDEDGVIGINSVSGGIEPYMYSLDGENFTDAPDFENLAAVTYTLVVEDANGCQAAVNFDITQPQELNVVLVASIDNMDPPTVTLGDSFDMEALVNTPLDSIHSVTWSPSEYLNCDTCLNVTATPIETTTFTVTIQANACDPVTTSITVYVHKEHDVYIPTAFSPDDDGNNDVFYIFGDENVAQVNSFAIYDRWGERLFFREKFAPNDPFFGWDGTHKGKNMNSAVYVWYAKIEFIDGEVEVFKGDVTIAR